MVRELTVRFHDQVIPANYDLPEFRGLDVSREQETIKNVRWLKISIRSPQAAFNEIFTSLAEDIARVVGKQTEEAEAAMTFRYRLYQWQKLLLKTGIAGLTQEQQQGLYSELWCLHELLLPVMSASAAIKAWTGPELTDRDFQFAHAIALEVKSSRSSGAPILTISSERQLDDIGLDALYLLHLSLEKLLGAGETLPEIVSTLRNIFSSDSYASVLFENKLFDAGYMDAHAVKYNTVSYTLHAINLYRIQDGFPRITPEMLMPGIGSVRYTIASSDCQPFTADLQAFKSQIKVS
jgi:hypothetical protein